MDFTSRQQRKISTRLIRKGALISETYTAFQSWDLQRSFSGNLESLKETNVFGARNQSWLKEIVTTLSSRFSDQRDLTPLIVLAKAGLALEKWKPCLLWHLASIDELYYRFALDWFYPAYHEGIYQIHTNDVAPFVGLLTSGQIASGGKLSEYGTVRAARDLLRMACDFDLLTGSSARKFSHYHLPLESFLYILYALSETEDTPRKLIDAPEWRIFLLSPEQVEQELMEIHQYHHVHFEMAGSLIHLTLPCNSLKEYAERLANQ